MGEKVLKSTQERQWGKTVNVGNNPCWLEEGSRCLWLVCLFLFSSVYFSKNKYFDLCQNMEL